eukprot:gene16580-biopygen9798
MGQHLPDGEHLMGKTTLPASGPRPARVRFIEFYRAARVRSRSSHQTAGHKGAGVRRGGLRRRRARHRAGPGTFESPPYGHPLARFCFTCSCQKIRKHALFWKPLEPGTAHMRHAFPGTGESPPGGAAPKGFPGGSHTPPHSGWGGGVAVSVCAGGEELGPTSRQPKLEIPDIMQNGKTVFSGGIRPVGCHRPAV